MKSTLYKVLAGFILGTTVVGGFAIAANTNVIDRNSLFQRRERAPDKSTVKRVFVHSS